MAEPDVSHTWLPTALVLSWLKKDETSDVIEQCRLAAAEWIEDQRPDLRATFTANSGPKLARMRQAGLLAVARLVSRMDTPNGVIAFAELGAGSLLSTDPDVKRMVGRRRPVTG